MPGAVGAAAAEDETTRAPSIAAARLAPDERIALDGRLDEAVWQRAAPAADFAQRDPREGAPASQATEVRVAFDHETLFIGAVLHDSAPESIIGRQRTRDVSLDADDSFAVALDPFGDGRTGYVFRTNPAGVLRDALLADGNSITSWDGIWDVRTARTADGWQVEMAVPFRTLNFDPAHDAWRVNFERCLRRENEASLWTAHRRTQGLQRTIYAGQVTGLHGLSQGRGVEVRPYAVARWREIRGASGAHDADGGFDFTYSLTPNLRAALTVNTDFADTEVDERQINLGRFPLFFPEKRAFFLESSSVFGFPGSDSIRPFYSRRIGLSREGPAPIQVGGRLTGTVGAADVGLLQLRTKPAFGRAAEDFSVLRTKVALWEESHAGVLYTRRAGGDDPDRHTLGVDARVRLADFGGGRRLLFEPYAIWTGGQLAAAGTSSWDERSTFGGSLDWNGAVWSIWAASRQVGEHYDPAVGFASSRGYRLHNLWMNFEQRPADSVVLDVDHELSVNWRTDLHDRLIQAEADFTAADLTFRSGDSAGVMIGWNADQFDEPFEPWDGVTLGAGRYEWWDVIGWARSAQKRPVVLAVELRQGGLYDGKRAVYEIDLETRPAPGLALALEAEQQYVRLPAGRFVTREWRGRVDYSFTTRHSLHVLGQFENESHTVDVQARFRWIVRPGSEVFLGYLHGLSRETDPFDARRRWGTLGREAALKGSYTRRF